MPWRSVLMVLAMTTAGDAAARSHLSGLAALRPRLDPTTLPRVPAACIDGRSGWRKVEKGDRAQLVELLKSFPWKARHFEAPTWNCHMRLELLCAPDLDGDRKNDFLVRLRWRHPREGRCNKESVRHEAVLFANRDEGWRSVDLVSYTAATGGNLAEARVAFVQLPDGKLGLTCKTQTENQGSGCKVLGYWVGKIVGGKIERIGEANPELCNPD